MAESHPSYYVGQAVTICIDDPAGRFQMNDEGIIIAIEHDTDYVVRVMVPGRGIYLFRNMEVVDSDWLWEQFLRHEEAGLVIRHLRDDGTIRFRITEKGRQVASGAVNRSN